MVTAKAKVGVVGCGNISGVYLKNAKEVFEILDPVACADLDMTRAQAQAKKYGIPRACTVEELLADPELEIVINLTTPDAHAKVALAALKAGKNIHNEKPLAVTRKDGRRILEEAKKRGLRVGCAPDTFMGGGLQTCRKLIDDGAIGEPVAATAHMVCHGHETWHPNPEFFYKPGGGPMFDMGPYYVTALVSLLGPARRVAGSAKITFPERTITSQPYYGTVVKVETPTHIAGIIDFASGAIGTILTSFDVWAAHLPLLEIYGMEGSLVLPDPNSFGGPVQLWRRGGNGWKEVPLTHGYAENSRGIGVADMAYALRSGRPHRASGEMAYHVLDIMQGFLDASDMGKDIPLKSACTRPAPLPQGLKPGTLDE